MVAAMGLGKAEALPTGARRAPANHVRSDAPHLEVSLDLECLDTHAAVAARKPELCNALGERFRAGLAVVIVSLLCHGANSATAMSKVNIKVAVM